MKETIVTIISVALFSWVLAGMPLIPKNFSKSLKPSPSVTVKPMQANKDVPTFNPNPEYRRKESNSPIVMEAEDILEELSENPCDKELKKKFVKSLKPLFKAHRHLVFTRNLTDEQITYFGGLNKAFERSVMYGLIEKKDLPIIYRIIMPSDEFSGMSACLESKLKDAEGANNLFESDRYDADESESNPPSEHGYEGGGDDF